MAEIGLDAGVRNPFTASTASASAPGCPCIRRSEASNIRDCWLNPIPWEPGIGRLIGRKPLCGNILSPLLSTSDETFARSVWARVYSAICERSSNVL